MSSYIITQCNKCTPIAHRSSMTRVGFARNTQGFALVGLQDRGHIRDRRTRDARRKQKPALDRRAG